MKRIVGFIISSLFICSIAGCGEDVFGDVFGETLTPVSLSEMPGDGTFDMSDIAVEALVAPIFEENGRSPFDGDFAMVINRQDSLKDVERWGDSFHWPEIDFGQYSLVIGKVCPTDMGYAIERHYVKKGISGYVLFVALKDIAETHMFGAKDCYFAALYPKLPDGQLKVKRANDVGRPK